MLVSQLSPANNERIPLIAVLALRPKRVPAAVMSYNNRSELSSSSAEKCTPAGSGSLANQEGPLQHHWPAVAVSRAPHFTRAGGSGGGRRGAGRPAPASCLVATETHEEGGGGTLQLGCRVYRPTLEPHAASSPPGLEHPTVSSNKGPGVGRDAQLMPSCLVRWGWVTQTSGSETRFSVSGFTEPGQPLTTLT